MQQPLTVRQVEGGQRHSKNDRVPGLCPPLFHRVQIALHHTEVAARPQSRQLPSTHPDRSFGPWPGVLHGIIAVQFYEVAMPPQAGEFRRLDDDRPIHRDDNTVTVRFEERAGIQ
jgi:hypothetical protein